MKNIIDEHIKDKVVGQSAQEYFLRVKQIVLDNTEDFGQLQENCGSWREGESR